MKILIKSFFPINRKHYFLMLLLICFLMILFEISFSKYSPNNFLMKRKFDFLSKELDDEEKRLAGKTFKILNFQSFFNFSFSILFKKDYENFEENKQTTPKLPFSLDRFGDYEPMFLSHKVIHLDRNFKKNELDFLKVMNEKSFFDKDSLKNILKEIKKKSSSVNYDQNLKKMKRRQALSNELPFFKNSKLKDLRNEINLMNKKDPLSMLKLKAKHPFNINRIYILSYFRSGSSFLGDLLQQHYKTFYLFEPLHYKTIATRLPFNQTKTNESISIVTSMLNKCDFDNADQYLKWISKKDNHFLLSWNRFLNSICLYNSTLCYEKNFIKKVCNFSEQRLTKLTRINLADLIKNLDQNSNILGFNKFPKEISMNNFDKSLLKAYSNKTLLKLKENLNISMFNLDKIPIEPIKIIYLVRDPRATFASRQSLNWCKKRACSNINILCNEMNNDLKYFEKFDSNIDKNKVINMKKGLNYPKQMFLVRFETIALNPENYIKKLFKLVNLPYEDTIKRFIVTHTDTITNVKSPYKNFYYKNELKNPHSTKRKSTKIPFDWINKLNWSKIEEIQSKCSYSMKKLGYKNITYDQFTNKSNEISEIIFTKFINITIF